MIMEEKVEQNKGRATELKEALDKLPTLDDLLPLLRAEEAKGLKIFIFKNEELKQYFDPKFKNVNVVTIAKTEDSAIWNLKNYKHSYLFKTEEEILEVEAEEVIDIVQVCDQRELYNSKIIKISH